MAIYWIDPYIDAAIGGIHGTVDGTTRNGSYSYPFAFTDFHTTSNATITAVNGVTFASGDEIRIKGQALTDFYMDIGVTGNILDRTGTSGGFEPVVDSAVPLDIVRSDLLAKGWQSAVMIYHDQGLYGSNNNFLLASTNNGFQQQTGQTYIDIYDNNNNFSCGYFRAKNGVASGRDQIAFLDNDYVLPLGRLSTNIYLFNFSHTSGIKITDGWTSETVRDGVTLIAIGNRSYFNAPRTMYPFCYSANRTTKNTTVFDLENTSILVYLTEDYRSLGKFSFSLNGYTGETDSYFKLKQWCSQGSSYQSLGYVDTDSSIATSSVAVDFGIFGQATTTYFPYGQTSNAAVLNFDNLIFGEKISMTVNSNYQINIGNIFVRNGTSDALISGYNPSNSAISGHIYGYTNVSNISSSSGGSVDLTGSTVSISNNPNYPGVGSGPSSGGSLSKAGNSFYTNNEILVFAENWYDIRSINPLNGYFVTDYGYGQIANFSGKLLCEGTDYRNSDVKIPIANGARTNAYQFNTINLSVLNDFDDKTLSFFTYQSYTNSVNTSLLCYNDTTDELTVQCNTGETSGQYSKAFTIPIEGGKPAADQTLTVSFDLEYSNPATQFYPMLVFLGNSTSPADMQYTTEDNVRTYTYSVSTNNFLLTEMTHVGIKVNLLNTGNASDRYYIRNMTAVVA